MRLISRLLPALLVATLPGFVLGQLPKKSDEAKKGDSKKSGEARKSNQKKGGEGKKSDEDFLKEKPAIGDTLPDLTVYTPNGKEMKTTSLRGQHVVLVFGCLT
jgi:hypothetical protein